MKQELLLLEDVHALGRSGEVVEVKPGYARNFLLPGKKAVVANKHSLRLQKKLQEERAKQAAIDRQESEALAQRIAGLVLETEVKVDPEGHLYGSVTATDIVKLFEIQGIAVERNFIKLLRPIKTVGVFDITLKLKEGVEAVVQLKVSPEGGLPQVSAPKKKEKKEEETTEEEQSE